MGRASLLGLCPNSLHKAEAWARSLGLRFGPVQVWFSTPSEDNFFLSLFFPTKNITLFFFPFLIT